MSRPHITVVKLQHTPEFVEYAVECPDFNYNSRWDVVGNLFLVPDAYIYRFRPTAIWQDKRVLPPHLYGLAQPARIAELRSRYRGLGGGAWAEAVHQCAVALMREGRFPGRLAYRWDVLWTAADQPGRLSIAG